MEDTTAVMEGPGLYGRQDSSDGRAQTALQRHVEDEAVLSAATSGGDR